MKIGRRSEEDCYFFLFVCCYKTEYVEYALQQIIIYEIGYKYKDCVQQQQSTDKRLRLTRKKRNNDVRIALHSIGNKWRKDGDQGEKV